MKSRFLLLALVGLFGVRMVAAQEPLVLRSLFRWQADSGTWSGGHTGWPNYFCWSASGNTSDVVHGAIKVNIGSAPNGTYYLTQGYWTFRIDLTNGVPYAYPPTDWTWSPADTSFKQGAYAAYGGGVQGILAYPYLEGDTQYYPGRYGSYTPRPFRYLENYTSVNATAQAGGHYVPRLMIAKTAPTTGQGGTGAHYYGNVVGDWYLCAADAAVTNPASAGADGRDSAAMTADPIDAITGAHLVHETPISIMGSTSPLAFTVSYNSKTSSSGWFAKGWSHPFEARVIFNTTARVDIAWSQYETVSYYLNSVDQKYVAATDGHLRERLTRNSDGSVSVQFEPNKSCKFAADGLISEIKSQASTVTVSHITLTHSVAGTKVFPSRISEQNTGVYLDIAYLSWSDAFHPSVITSSDGRTAQFAYDTSGRLNRITGANGMWMDLALDQNSTSGLIYAAYRADGTRIFENTFDSQARVLTQKDGRGNITSFAYSTSNTQNRYTDVTDRAGRTKRYSYDVNQRLSKLESGSYSVTFGYNSRGFRTSAQDSLGLASTVAYTPSGNVTTATAPDGSSDGATYDAVGNLKTFRSAAGGQFTIGYNANNDATTITDPNGAVTQIQYGAAHQPSAIISPAGGTTNLIYQNGRVAQVTDAAGNTTAITYNGMGLPETVTNAKGGTTTYLYDGTGQVLITWHSDQTQTSATYNPSGKIATYTDQFGKTTLLGYDENNNLTSITNALTQTAYLEYDAEDRLKASVTPMGGRRTILYDSQGRVSKVTDPTGVSVTYESDSAGRVTGIRDGKGVKQVGYQYDAAGRLASTSDFHGASTTYKYNPQGGLGEVIDALGLGIWYFYDNQGRLNFVSHSSGLSTFQERDSQGNVADFYNAAGEKTSIDHFNDNLPSGLTTATGKHAAYDYDNLNEINSVVSPSGSTLALARNPLGQLTDATDFVGHLQYTYDARGALKTVVEGSKTITREYDDLGRMSAFIDGNGNRIEYTYDADSRLSTLKYPGGRIVTYTYDAAGRMKTVMDWVGRTTTYSYDQNGRLDYTANANGTNESLIYSQDQSLQALFHGSGTTIFYYDAFTYDAIGRIASTSKSPDVQGSSAELPVAMTYDADNRLSTFAGTPVVFDADGNMLTGPTGTSPPSSGIYTYDARRRLISAGGLSYGYDAENRRVSFTSTAGITNFIYNPQPDLAQVLMRTAPDGTTTYFVYGLGLIGEETNGIFTTYHFDRLGSTVALSSESGAVLGHVRYSPYGTVTYQDSAIQTPFLFCGRYGVQADSSGLNYMRARYYNPQIKRFVNQDVLLGTITGPASMNRFAYASGNPVSGIDPFGLLTYFVHGFNSSAEGAFQPGFRGKVLGMLRDNSELNFDWTGAYGWTRGLGERDLNDGATLLAARMRADYEKYPCQVFNVVAHSDGGNVALRAIRLSGVPINRFVTLGTPIFPGYNYTKPPNVSEWINAYSSWDGWMRGDWMQRLGGWPHLRTAPWPTLLEVVPVARTVPDPKVFNVDIPNRGHSKLHSFKAMKYLDDLGYFDDLRP